MSKKISLAIVFTFLWGIIGFGQLEKGFSAEEAKNMIQICNSFSYLDLYGSDKEILPKSYKKVYTSPSYGMDNRFQVYRNEKERKGVISFRGTTGVMTSWMANLYASTIDVKGEIKIDEDIFHYQFGKEDDSKVHAGYSLAVYYLKEDLLKQIAELNKKGIYDFYITGHSQGGALAQLVRAYFEYLPAKELDPKNSFKVYAFANPMVGNPSFVEEYNRAYVDTEMSFLIHNPKDMVPMLPYSYKDSTFWQDNLLEFLKNREGFSKTNFIVDAMGVLFHDRVIAMAQKMSLRIEKQLFDQLGQIEMPTLYHDFDYMHTGNVVRISPAEYPLELKDSTILQNDSLMRIYKRDKNGDFEDKSLYTQRNNMQQHKTYNYYTSILRDYFPKEYGALKQKYFIDPKK